MPVLSVDLAYRSYSDIGAVVLNDSGPVISCDLVRIPLEGTPSPEVLGCYLDGFCADAGIRLLLLDGPQAWKASANGLTHSRCCERELNTPAKTGLPGSVKPANYGAFVAFSIGVFDALATRGWERLASVGSALEPDCRIVIESFPLSAWRSLGVEPLPAKAKTKPAAIAARLVALKELFPLRLSGGAPTHDELQALVAGLAGVALERNEWGACVVSGLPPVIEDNSWREGFIVNAVRPAREALSNGALRAERGLNLFKNVQDPWGGAVFVELLGDVLN